MLEKEETFSPDRAFKLKFYFSHNETLVVLMLQAHLSGRTQFICASSIHLIFFFGFQSRSCCSNMLLIDSYAINISA